MFRRIQIKNFLSCKDVVIDNIDSMAALVGRNGSGKTNILKTIWRIANDIILPQSIKISRNKHLAIKLLIELDNKYYQYELQNIPNQETVFSEKLTVQKSFNEESQILFNRQEDTIKVTGYDTDITVGNYIPSLPTLAALLPKEVAIKKAISLIISFLQTVRYYPLDETQLPTETGKYVTHSDYEDWLNKNQFDNNNSVVMQLLNLSLKRTDEFEEIKSLVGPEGLNIIKNINIFIESARFSESGNESETFYIISFQPSSLLVSSIGYDYNALSFGTRRLLRLIVSVIYDKSSVMLLEQPEDGIHIGLLHKLIPLLKSYSDKSQIILASHSPEVLNRLEPQEIRLVIMENVQTKVRSLDENELEIAKQFINEEGTLSDFIETIQEN